MGSTKFAALLFALFLSASCGGRKETPAPARSASSQPPTPAPTLPGLKATLDHKPLPLRTALAYSRGGAALHITLSTHPITCKDIGGEGTVRLAGETTVDVTLAPRLLPDGNSDWRVMRARLGPVTRQGDLGSAKVTAFDPRKPVSGELELAVIFPPPEAHTLNLAGRIQAEGCGLRPYSLDAKVRPQKDLRIELAGKAILAHGASVTRRRDGDLMLLFTSEPHACAVGARGSDFAITLQLSATGEAKSARVEGYSLPKLVEGKVEGMAVRFDTAGDAGVRVEVAGTTELNGYRLMLDGNAEAESCDAAK
ncbi:MAG TPA: hypothetical protein VFB62_05055 [Polyangiaceae bacterium]|jgi:hypothetical protein|nr:hypothetical protein [Polyangiaceae bacterium]